MAFLERFLKNSKTDIADDLNEQQRNAVEFRGKHLLVLAGAGTGKTKTIVARAEYLLKNGVQPKNIVILSFTRKSAKEIAERLKISVSGNINKNEITGQTFHSWCNEIMHRYPDHFPHHRYTPLDEDDRISAMALAIGKNFRDGDNKKISKEAVVDIYSYAINTFCSLSDAILIKRYGSRDKNDMALKKRVDDERMLIAPVIQKYLAFKKERRYIDYDDMPNVVADVLEKNETVRNEATNRFRHILVDEMQDTNPLQYKLLRSFVDKSHLFCVGDDAQSIYGFRGADFKTIHSFSDIFSHSETYKLFLNYRSTQEILDLSNWVLKQSSLDYKKNLIAHRGKGNKPNLIHVENDWEEADIITDNIIQCVADGVKYADTLVLGRSVWSLSKVEGACLKKKIPYIKLGGTSLMQSAHVRDVASAMRIVANNYDELAWIRFLQLWDDIGEIKASRIISNIITLDTFEKMIDFLRHSNMREIVKDIPNTLTKVHQFADRPYQAMTEAVDAMRKLLEKKYKDEWIYRASDFEILGEVAKSTGSITEFITEYVLDPKAETTLKWGSEVEEDYVTLSTIHSAKGLEAKIVHIVNVNPYSYPSVRIIKNGDDAIEEERRCLYVALTRAKDKLNVYRNSRSIHTQYIEDKKEEIVKAKNLYFLNELPPELVCIVVNGNEEKSFPKYNEEIQAEAEFPDFDFE